MSEKINVTMNIQVVKGPTLSETLEQEVEAYDKIDVTIATAAKDKEVELQPGSASGQVKFLMINLADSDDYGSKVTYTVNVPSTDASTPKVTPLDAAQVLVGEGAVKLLDSAPKSLFFTNALTNDISVQILIGRDATP